jgi:hypothetical protein
MIFHLSRVSEREKKNEARVFVFWSQRLGPDVREGKRRQYNYIGTGRTLYLLNISV